jgi:hypothetical protein
MIVLLWFLFRLFLSRRLVDEAKRQAERGLVGSMEGAEMDMSVKEEGTLVQRVVSPRASLDQPPLRDGLGCRLEGHSGRFACSRSPGSVGAQLVLAEFLLDAQSPACTDMG